MFVTISGRSHLVGLLPHLNEVSLSVLNSFSGHFGVNFTHDEAKRSKPLIWNLEIMNFMTRWAPLITAVVHNNNVQTRCLLCKIDLVNLNAGR